MMRFAMASVVFAFGCHCGAAPPTSSTEQPTARPASNVPPASAAEAQLFADSTNAFAFDLWEQLRANDGDLAVSPASISAALAMTWAGAEGQTASEIASTMHFGSDAPAFHRAAGGVLSAWSDPNRDAYELAVANRLFGQSGYQWQDSFLEITRESYRAELEPLDFRSAAEPARLHINTWVADQTRTRIRDLIPAGEIGGDTRMVLTNAIYFRANWASQFESSATHAQTFHAPGGPTQVPTMHQTAELQHAQTDGVQLLGMPYAGGDLSMLIVLPDARDGLSELESRLSPGALNAFVAALEERRVQVSLPKFRVDPPRPISLAATLQSMGMRDAFDSSRADFSAMAANTQERLYVSAVFHKAFVAVDEEGTEAAAATAVILTREGGRMEPPDVVEFRADHPFLFFIRDNASGAILFMGRVTSPG